MTKLNFRPIWSGIKETIHKNWIDDFTFDNFEFKYILLRFLIIGLCLFISVFWAPFVWIALFFSCLFVVTQWNVRCVYYIVFLLPMMTIFRVDNGGLYFLSIVSALCILVNGIRWIYSLIKHKQKTNWWFVFMFICVCVYLFISSLLTTISISILFSLLLGLSIVFIIYQFKNEVNFKELAFCFILGVVFSILIGFFWEYSDRLQSFGNTVYGANMKRFSGTGSHANMFAGEVVIAISLVFTLVISGKIKNISLPIYALLFTSLIMAISKGAIINFTAIIVLFAVILIVDGVRSKRLSKNILILTNIVIITCCVLLIFSDYTNAIVERLFGELAEVKSNASATQTKAQVFTTGRVDIWKQYYEVITASARNVIIGCGTGAENIGTWDGISAYSPHNTLIQGIYYCGIVGLVLIFAWLLTGIKKTDLKNFKWVNALPLIALFIFMNSEAFFYYEFFVYALPVVCGLFDHETKKCFEVKNDDVPNKLRIPKVLHFIWLGGTPLPKHVQKCIQSWKRVCPDYEIRKWDESNLDINFCEFCKNAYENKKYELASNALGYQIIHSEGGILLGVDVKLLKNIDAFLCNESFLSFDNKTLVNPGLVFGGTKGNKFSKEMLELYSRKEFSIRDTKQGKIVYTLTTKKLQEKGLKLEDRLQYLDDITIYPAECFSPRNVVTDKTNITHNTFANHLEVSLHSKNEKFLQLCKKTSNFFTNGWFGVFYSHLKKDRIKGK